MQNVIAIYRLTPQQPPNLASHISEPCNHKPKTMQGALLSVVDDDESVRESLPDLLREFGFVVLAFSSAEEFLHSNWVAKTQCLLLDIAMPGMTGPDLQTELKQRQREIPIIFISALIDETVRRRVLERGAIACLFKPFDQVDLLEAVHCALDAA